METWKQPSFLDDEPDDKPKEEEMEEQTDKHDDPADEDLGKKIEGTQATTIKGLQKELYGWKPIGAEKEIGPGRKKALLMLEKLRKMKEEGK